MWRHCIKQLDQCRNAYPTSSQAGSGACKQRSFLDTDQYVVLQILRMDCRLMTVGALDSKVLHPGRLPDIIVPEHTIGLRNAFNERVS